ncbi:Yip1 family protein [Caulobacter sp. UNC358MFTsu5.1]|uniref:Yip1 family protein n=1 Tax=Caulobacter sp. UNC358MFTsu5.1 TaxID=1449049 RepID=UPI0004A7398B|nr:Yip1 family protein [Caulobacter sp. UNC358MFTsu5.1]
MTVIEPGSTSSDLVGRVKRLLLSPSAEWERIDAEPATIKGLYVGYVCILAAIPPLAGLIGGQVFGVGALGFSFKPSLVSALVTAVVSYGLNLLSVFLVALIIDALAPSFDGQKDRVQAFKVAAYSYTAAWVFGILGIFPPLGAIAALISLYGFYLLYLGLPRLMKAPKEKAVGYTVVTVICAIVLSIIIGAVTGAIAGAAMFGAANRVAGAGHASGTMEINGAKVDMGKLEAASRQMEAASKQMNSGKPVPTVPADTLKGLLPGGVAGFSRISLESQSGGAAGMSMSSARGEYTKGDANFTLAVTDLGAMAGMAAMAGAVDAQSSEETAHGYKKVGKVGGRMTTEEWDRESKYGQYSVLVGDRFTVEANGTADSIDSLKQAVAAVDMGRLEGLAR